MKKPISEDEIEDKDVFGSLNQLSESEPHILRKVLIGIIVLFMLGLGLVMIIGAIFADACSTKSAY